MKSPSETALRFFVQGRIWIDSEKGPFLGYGRIELLKKIAEYGSITKAAKSMNMAYRQAWHLIESMNAKAENPLVLTSTGGKGGGGATLTEEGIKMIHAFEMLESEFASFLKMKSEGLNI